MNSKVLFSCLEKNKQIEIIIIKPPLSKVALLFLSNDKTDIVLKIKHLQILINCRFLNKLLIDLIIKINDNFVR
jgi:hypothetical protein